VEHECRNTRRTGSASRLNAPHNVATQERRIINDHVSHSDRAIGIAQRIATLDGLKRQDRIASRIEAIAHHLLNLAHPDRDAGQLRGEAVDLDAPGRSQDQREAVYEEDATSPRPGLLVLSKSFSAQLGWSCLLGKVTRRLVLTNTTRSIADTRRNGGYGSVGQSALRLSG
jgi:hypothetical protein